MGAGRALPGSPEPIEGRCGSKLRLSEKRYGHARFCVQHPLKGASRCKLHGGKSLAGAEHPNFVHGKYSIALKGSRLLDHFTAARNDPTLISLRDDVALMQARTTELLERLSAGDGGGSVKDIGKWFLEFKAAHAARDAKGQIESLTHLDAAIDAATRTEALWDDIKDTVDRKRALSAAEVQRAFKAHQVMTANQAGVLVGLIVESIRRNVTDPEALKRIAGDIQAIVTSSTPTDTEAA
jgi:hypothetical protein